MISGKKKWFHYHSNICCDWARFYDLNLVAAWIACLFFSFPAWFGWYCRLEGYDLRLTICTCDLLPPLVIILFNSQFAKYFWKILIILCILFFRFSSRVTLIYNLWKTTSTGERQPGSDPDLYSTGSQCWCRCSHKEESHTTDTTIPYDANHHPVTKKNINRKQK